MNPKDVADPELDQLLSEMTNEVKADIVSRIGTGTRSPDITHTIYMQKLAAWRDRCVAEAELHGGIRMIKQLLSSYAQASSALDRAGATGSEEQRSIERTIKDLNKVLRRLTEEVTLTAASPHGATPTPI